MILYCHGGGYISGGLDYSGNLAVKLAMATGFRVYSFAYRLAPEHPYPAAPEDAVKAWNYLMLLGYGAKDVIVAGDSAGGNLALSLVQILKEKGFDVVYTSMLPDERDMIREELVKCADELGIALVLTTGGTGFSPRDITPEAAMEVFERPTPGIPEAMRAESMRITPKGCLSRSVAGIRGRTLIITLPGSKKASQENILAVIDPVAHGLDMLYSEGSADCAK